MKNKDVLKAISIITCLPLIDGIFLPVIISTDKLPLVAIVMIITTIITATVLILNHYIDIVCERMKRESE